MSELKFKVGDRVKVVTKRSGQFGEVATIMDCAGISYPYGVQFSVGCERINWFKESELELVSEAKEEVIAPKINQQTLDALQDFQYILRQLSIFNEKYNTKLRTVVE